MTGALVFIVFLGVLSVNVAVTLTTTVPSIPVTGIQGRSIELPCNLHTGHLALTSVKWVDLVYNTNPQPQTIFSNLHNPQLVIDSTHPNAFSYEVGEDYTLRISDLKLADDAGKYMCIGTLKNGTIVEKVYYLYVGTQLECTGVTQLKSNQETDLKCSMSFSGTQPVIQWYHHDKLMESTEDFDIAIARKQIRIHATHRHDRSNYTCNVTFGDMKESCALTLNVTYLVRDLKITPETTKLRPGDEMKCSAKGNPTPVITMSTWTDSDTMGQGWKAFRVDSSFSGKNITVRCSASNDVTHSPISTHSTFHVAGPRKHHQQHSTTTTATTTTSSLQRDNRQEQNVTPVPDDTTRRQVQAKHITEKSKKVENVINTAEVKEEKSVGSNSGQKLQHVVPRYFMAAFLIVTCIHHDLLISFL